MLYFSVLRFSFLRSFAYSSEISIRILMHFLEIFFLIFFWNIFTRSSNQATPLEYFISYFLMATGISTFVMAQWGEFQGQISSNIKNGKINNYLLKPYGVLRYLHALAIGSKGIELFFALIYIVVGILYQSDLHIVRIVYFAIFLLFAYLISLAINIITATFYFHIPEAGGISNAINLTKWVLSGLLIPISLFPEPYKTLVLSTPFPWIVYAPINVLKNNLSDQELLSGFLIALFWTLVLNVVAMKFWKESSKKYEAIGI